MYITELLKLILKGISFISTQEHQLIAQEESVKDLRALLTSSFPKTLNHVWKWIIWDKITSWSLWSLLYFTELTFLSGNQFPPVAAQDLQFVLKAGYLEKRRKDHSFLGFEWQKRWCAISKTVFYYYGSDKDKQQKGEFALEGYTIRMNNSLRKDAKKDCCFEISAPDKHMESNTIPEEEAEEEYDDVAHASSDPVDDSIYEELPGIVEIIPYPFVIRCCVFSADGKNTDYANFYQGLWDCTGDVPDELTFKRGDVIYILSKEYNRFGWWVGEMKGTIGLVPKAYIMEMYDI
uniref:Src kinase associated phosphoprotein 2 n=1 Tax=Nothoprocta perdicaria TaxID=30464 RepID=A0A8C6YQ11_NOTPE